MSTERSGGQLWLKGFQQVLQPLVAQIRLRGEGGVILPNRPVEISVENPRISRPLAYDGALGAYTYSYIDDQQMERTVTIENSSSFAHKLSLLERYEVTQVMVRDVDSGDVDPDLWEAARQFQTGGGINTNPTRLEVSYTIFHPDGSELGMVTVPIENPVYTFNAPVGVGDVRVEAQVVQVTNVGNRQAASPRNVVAISLATPTPKVPPTPTPTATPDFPTLVSVQPANVREWPGTAYPRIGLLNAGQSYRIVGKNQAGDWWQINFGDKKGWVFGELAKPSGPLEGVAVITDIPAPPAAPAVVSAPAPSGGFGFGYGVQAHMVHNNEVGWVMETTKLRLRFGWVKQQIEWKVFEPSPGNYQWPAMQGMIDSANGAGINLLFSVVNAPSWAREPGHAAVGGPPQDPQTFARFLGAMAGKYCGTSLKAIEVWNEQNLHYEWGDKPINPGEYMALLRPAYASIKAACPSMQVISGALTPAGDNGSLPGTTSAISRRCCSRGWRTMQMVSARIPAATMCHRTTDMRQPVKQSRQLATASTAPATIPTTRGASSARWRVIETWRFVTALATFASGRPSSAGLREELTSYRTPMRETAALTLTTIVTMTRPGGRLKPTR